jgi:predicted dehydrogenase
MAGFRWGILGTGRIANKFAAGLAEVEGAELVAVGSRTRESAEAFGAKWNVRKRHASYSALAADPEVDAIYVSTPHNLHCENTLVCLAAGKPVLCEKPFAMKLRRWRWSRCAREHGASSWKGWTRWNRSQRVRELVREADPARRGCSRAISVSARLSIGGRLFDLELGGGALDVGVYCISYAHMIFGRPRAGDRPADRGATGADEQSACVLRYRTARWPLLRRAPQARLSRPRSGTDGWIRVPRFYDADRLLLNSDEIRVERRGNGFNYEAAEVQRLVRASSK